MGIVGTMFGAAKSLIGTGNKIAGAVKHETQKKWKPAKTKQTHFKKANTL